MVLPLEALICRCKILSSEIEVTQGSHALEKVQKFPFSTEKVQKIFFSTEKVQKFYFSTEKVQKFQNFVVSVQKKYRKFKISLFQNHYFHCFQSNFGSADELSLIPLSELALQTQAAGCPCTCMQAEAQFGCRTTVYNILFAHLQLLDSYQ